MSLKFTLTSAAWLLFSASQAFAYDLTAGVAYYQPSDGIVQGLYDTDKPSYVVKFGIPFSAGLSMVTSLLYYDFESRIANLESDVELITASVGFKKEFAGENPNREFNFSPYFGASLGTALLTVQGENELTEKSAPENQFMTMTFNWEIGAAFQNVGVPGVDIEISAQEVAIYKKLLGNISVGGRFYMLGATYHFAI